MSKVVDAVKGAITGSQGGFFSTLFAITNPYLAFAVNLAGNMIVSAVLSMAVSGKKSNFQSARTASQLQKRSEMIKQPIVARETVYGETKKSGVILFMESTNNTKDLHIVLALASHEIQSVEKVYFGEDELTLASAGTDSNGVTQFKVTSPSKYATESRFTTKTRTLIVSEYTTMPFNRQLPFGGYNVENGEGVQKGTTSITLVSDTAFTIQTTDTININGVDYGISSGGSSSASGSRHTLAVTISEGLRTDVRATSIFQNTPSGQTRITPFNNPNTPKPFLAGTSTTTNYAILATQKFTDTSDLTVRIKKHLGTDTQQADADLVSEVPQWTTAHTLSGISYLYVKLKYDADVFPNGIPNISAEIKGKKVLDFRTGSTAFSANPALILYDYLSDTRYGLNISTDNIDTTSFTTVADICDENITLSAGGTEKRYEAHGIIYSDQSPMNAIDDIISSCLGVLSYSNGKFILAGGKYVSPTITLDEDDFKTLDKIVDIDESQVHSTVHDFLKDKIQIPF